MRTFGLFLFLSLSYVSAWGDLAGRVRLEESSFFKKQVGAVQQNEASAVFEFEMKNKISDNWRWRLEPKFRLSSAPKTASTDFDGDLRDSQLEGKFGSLRLQIGTFIKAWEGTDGLNPMDLATMKNIRDPLAQDNLSSLGFTLAGGEGLLTWDLLYVPRQTLSRLPGEKSAWWPRSNNLPLQRENQILLVPDEPEYELLGREQIDRPLEHNAGLRIQFHGDKWDFSVAGFDGAAQTPLLQPDIIGTVIEASQERTVVQMDNPLRLRPIDYRRRSVAGAFVFTHESWILRLAGRHDQPVGGDSSVPEWLDPVAFAGQISTESLLPTWSDQWVAGVEKTVTIRDQNVVFLLQASYGQRPESGGVLSSQDLFDRAVLYGFRWPWSDVTTIQFGGFVETKRGASLNHLQWQRKIDDPSTIEVSVDLIQGPKDTLLGIWSEQSRGSIAYVYQF